jgi:hypothetical protein
MQLQTAVRPRPVRLRGKFVSVVLVASAGWFAIPAAVQAAQPDFGPNVLVIEPSTPSATIQAALDAASKETEFGSGRHAVLFKPGTYAVDAQIGYYTTVAGLGFHPDDVVINGGLRVEGQINTASWTDSALINFWRSVENLSVTPTGGTTRWAVSQASPMRRVHIRGGLALMPAWWGYPAVDSLPIVKSTARYSRDPSSSGIHAIAWSGAGRGRSGTWCSRAYRAHQPSLFRLRR